MRANSLVSSSVKIVLCPPLVTITKSWKKLHTVHVARVNIFSRIEDIFVHKSRKYVAILVVMIFINSEVNVEE